MKEISKRLLDQLINTTKYLLFKLVQFGTFILSSLFKFGQWIVRPKIRNFILGIITISISVWTLNNYYYPEFEIEFSDPLKSDNIFSSVLNIRNNGNCNIYDFTIHFEICDFLVTNQYGSTIGAEEGVCIRSNQPLPIQEIIVNKRSKSIDFDIGRLISHYGSNVDELVTYKAKLNLYIEYKYWQKKMSKHDTLNFRTSELIDNNIIWINN